MTKNIVILLCVSLSAAGGTRLGSADGDMTLTKEGSPYIVTEEIAVQKNERLIIEKGCVLLFKPFTGITVYGELKVRGADTDPVVFTSILDTGYSDTTSDLLPNPFDWNGILITQNAVNVSLSNFILAFSVYGIKSQTETLSVHGGVFSQNGQYHFTVNDAIMPVADGVAYIYHEKSPEKKQRDTGGGSLQKAAAVVVGCAGLVSGGFALWSMKKRADIYDVYKTEPEIAEQKRLKIEGRQELTKTAVFGGVSCIAIPAAIVIFMRAGTGGTVKSALKVTPWLEGRSRGVIVSFNL
jgi:hypothetical protein